jgi:outer membrane protein insertion porin family
VLGGAGLLTNNFGGLIGLDVVALRGYQDQSIDNRGQYFPIYNRFVLELRYPITLNQSAPVWVLGFAEGGNGYTNFRNYNPFDIKRSAGFGIRVMLPMVGLLGLDWAYGFDSLRTGPAAQPEGGRFHFIIGQQF